MRKPTLLTLFLIVFVDLIGFGLIMPLLPSFANDFGADGIMAGWLIAIFSLAQFLFAPVWGRLSDQTGRRPILLVSLVGSALSYALLAMAHSYWALFGSRLLAGICAANIAVANAYVADITTKENRSKGMGVIGAAFGLGFVLGPALAGLLGRYGNAVLAFTAAGVSAVSFVLALCFLPESRPGNRKAPEGPSLWADPFRDWSRTAVLPLVGPLVAISFLVNLAFSDWETIFSLFLRLLHYDIPTIGWFFAYLGLIVALFQGGIVGRLVKRFGEPILLQIGLAASALALFLTPLCSSTGQLLGCLTLLAVGFGTLRPVLFGTASILTSPERQGAVLGVLQGAGSLGRVAGPLLGGWLLDHGAGLPFWAGTLLLFLALGLTPSGKAVLEAKEAQPPAAA